MARKVKISMTQFRLLVFIYTIGSTILLTPSGLASMAKQDAWISAIVGIGIGVCLAYLYCSLAMLYPDKSFIEYSEIILGKWLGKLVSLSFILFCFIGATTVLSHTGNFLVTQLYPETPLVMVNIMIALAITFGILYGLEVLSRAAEIFIPWIIILFFFMLFATAPQIEITNIQPILEYGPKPIFLASLTYTATAVLPCIVFSMIIPYVEEKKKLRNSFISSIILGGMAVLIVIFLCILVLGSDLTARSMFPSYVLARKINIGNFLQRIEVIVAILWFITIYYKIMFYFYSFVTGIAEFIKLKEYRPIAIPLTTILLVYSLVVYPSVSFAIEWDTYVWVPFAIFNGLLIPLLLFIVGKIRIKIQQN